MARGDGAGASLGKHRACSATARERGSSLPAAAEHFVVLSSGDLDETKLYCIGLGLHKFAVCSAAYVCSPSNLPLDGGLRLFRELLQQENKCARISVLLRE